MSIFRHSKFNPRRRQITSFIDSQFGGRQNLQARKQNLVAAPAVKAEQARQQKRMQRLLEQLGSALPAAINGALGASLAFLQSQSPVVLFVPGAAVISGYLSSLSSIDFVNQEVSNQKQRPDAQTERRQTTPLNGQDISNTLGQSLNTEELKSAAQAIEKRIWDVEPTLGETVDLINYKSNLEG